MVVDASAILAVLKNEPAEANVRRVLGEVTTLVMASVTLAETVLIGLRDGRRSEDTAAFRAALDIEIVPVDETMAKVAAKARHRYPIRFGDAFVYALAKVRGLPVLTLDTEFAKTDVALVSLD